MLGKVVKKFLELEAAKELQQGCLVRFNELNELESVGALRKAAALLGRDIAEVAFLRGYKDLKDLVLSWKLGDYNHKMMLAVLGQTEGAAAQSMSGLLVYIGRILGNLDREKANWEFRFCDAHRELMALATGEAVWDVCPCCMGIKEDMFKEEVCYNCGDTGKVIVHLPKPKDCANGKTG